MDTATFFPLDYGTSRQNFRAAATRLGWQLEAHAIDALGPAGETLSIDVALGRAGPSATTRRCVVVSSGLHGVEAFLGSAIQLAAMRAWLNAPPSVRVVFIHALNPYGFAWLRRANEHNVDLNRNFLLDGEDYRGAPPGYAGLDGLLNPKHAPRWDAFLLRAIGHIARQGLPALQAAIAAGQYEFPQGLFFGGSAPSQTMQILDANLSRWLGDCDDIVHLDLHSGLGRWASYKFLIDYALNPPQRARLATCFGESVLEETNAPRANGATVGYATRGGLGQWCVAQQRERHYAFAYAEFGAYDIIRTVAGLRAENQAHFFAEPDSATTRSAKHRLRELLCPDAREWRERVLEQGLDLVRRAAAPV